MVKNCQMQMAFSDLNARLSYNILNVWTTVRSPASWSEHVYIYLLFSMAVSPVVFHKLNELFHRVFVWNTWCLSLAQGKFQRNWTILRVGLHVPLGVFVCQCGNHFTTSLLLSAKLMTDPRLWAQSAMCCWNRCCCERFGLRASVLWCLCLPASPIIHTYQNNDKFCSSLSLVWIHTSPTHAQIHSNSPLNHRRTSFLHLACRGLLSFWNYVPCFLFGVKINPPWKCSCKSLLNALHKCVAWMY